jgi:hypothetical protein
MPVCCLSGMRQSDTGGTAPGSTGPVRAAADRPDRLSYGGLPDAAPCGAGVTGTGSGHTAQSGQHSELCRPHFKRNILGIQEIGKTTDAERFCRDALALHARLFRLWHRFRDGPGVRYGPITREQLIAKSIPLEKKFFALANRYLDSPDKDVANLALALMQHFEKFFLRHEGVEPTNNVAELRRTMAQDQLWKPQRPG